MLQKFKKSSVLALFYSSTYGIMPFNRSSSNTFGRKRNSQSQKTSRKRTLSESEDSEEAQYRRISNVANNVVRYIVIVGGSNIPIKRADIIKTCFSGKASSHANAIFKKAKAILKDVYGYELLDCETKYQKMYVLRNTLIRVKAEDLREIPSDNDKVLKFLVLSHIFMSGESSTDVSLFAFLQSCKIDPNTLHPIYGNIMEFINTRMTREKLIAINVNDETRKVTYSWGSNAENTVSKMEILKFVASFGNKNLKSWRAQFENATEQFENDEENVENENDSNTQEE